ncbi:male sterility protein-domain-containing protein [Penicillium nucicola]|uniref:male sterility protein-domain-containing protein n=1 Tax=Penicillium nucicola TaxID=1850975 RepID=UPI0025457244|nr:male sterility protein-domain-containing protein [Penicillium nucicola]KAJ5762473.1 male sterility protein-domain-containing protein [Penicillium nucicola]
MTSSPADIDQWFQGQVVFLTGGTGTLGGCLLYKLALQLPTRRIFVLCRGSVYQAISKLENSMPEQMDDILETQKVCFVVGDITKPNLGLQKSDLLQLQTQVTVVINSAGNVSLLQDLRGSISDNCVPHMALMNMCAQFTGIKIFLHISSAFVNSFLPGGDVGEQVYNAYGDATDATDAHKDLQAILSTGSSNLNSPFVAPYAHAKYIAERLMLETAPLPLLVVRPSNIGPAIRDPAPLYGIHMVIPIHTYVQCFLSSSTHAQSILNDKLSAQNILDEVPVDLVANTCLLHLAIGTTGVVHSAADLYVPRTLEDFRRKSSETLPANLMERLHKLDVGETPEFVSHLAHTFTCFFRNWKFECKRSDILRDIRGPLALRIENHDPEEFLELRIHRVAQMFLDSVTNMTLAYSSR